MAAFTIPVVVFIVCTWSSSILCNDQVSYMDIIDTVVNAQGAGAHSKRHSKELHSHYKKVFKVMNDAIEEAEESPMLIAKQVDNFLVNTYNISESAPLNVSDECQESTNMVLQALWAREQWALQSKIKYNC